jgi:threonine synthase
MARTIRFLCGGCGKEFGSHLDSHACPACGGAISLKSPQSRFPVAEITARPATLWRYSEALPSTADPVTLGESVTPLVPFEIAGQQLLAKCEFTCPTGSYKDRGATVLMTHLKESGTRAVVEDSSGNAGAAMAAYAARAGIDITIFCPASAAAGKLVQIQAYGATLRRVEGPRPRATDALIAHVEETGAEYASHLWHPLFLQGVKTMAFEICEQLQWDVPDVVLCPVGAGSILLGLHMGFSELRQAGIVDRLPRLVAVQAANNAALLQAFTAGDARVQPLPDPLPTLAEGIALPAPVRDREVLSALRETGGTVVAVTEAAILAGLSALGRCGFFVEPTAAVIWDGFEQLQRCGFIKKGEKAVAVLSGNGLKAAQLMADNPAMLK